MSLQASRVNPSFSGRLSSKRNIRRFAPAILLLCGLAFQAVFAQAAPKISVRAEKEDAVYQKNEKIVFRISVMKNGMPIKVESVSYRLTGDGGFSEEGALEIGLDGGAVECSLPTPGFVLCRAFFQENGENLVEGYGGAGVDPLNIRSRIPPPEDFDEFWDRKKAELAALPMNPKCEPVDVERYRPQGVEVFDVTVDCTGGKPLRAYLVKPLDARKGKHPILINYHGAGIRTGSYLRVVLEAAKRGAIALDVNAHGIENGKPREYYDRLFAGELKGYTRKNEKDREKYYFLGMYLRVFRSLEYMKTLPEWDGRMIAVRGNSQGGGQALVAAGSDPAVVVCRAAIPALCYPLGYLEGNAGGWPNALRGKTVETADPALVRTLPYFDAALFAARIRTAECFLSTGFIDRTCSPTSVLVAHNNIRTKKRFFATPTAAHAVPKSTDEAIEELFWKIVLP